jgi:GT2 family glycosyltransferase
MIDIVIVNWNGGGFIKDCIDSINYNSDRVVGKIIIVDNNSSDGSEYEVENLPNVHLIRLEDNYGFSRACNIGATKSDNKYLLFLNPDTIVYPGTLKRVFLFMEAKKNSNIAICGIQQRDRDGCISRHSNRCPSLSSFFYKTIGLSLIFHKLGHVMKEWSHTDSRKVDHIIGSFYFIRRNIFNELQGFDERFFMYLEDLDLSCRVKKIGLSSMYLSDVYIEHFCGGSSQQVKSHRLFYSLRSRLLYIEKYFGRLGFFMILSGVLTIELLLRLIKALFSFSLASVREVLLGYGKLVKWIFKSQIFFNLK